MAKKMKRKRWAEAHIGYWAGRKIKFYLYITRPGQSAWYGNLYAHRRSARRAAIQWAKREGYTLRWI